MFYFLLYISLLCFERSLTSFFLSVIISASVGAPGSMYELDGNGKYNNLCDLDATRLRRSASRGPSAAGKVDGSTTYGQRR
jgi:hypothetical protein